jgi:hypothetical protein
MKREIQFAILVECISELMGLQDQLVSPKADLVKLMDLDLC